MDVKYKHIVQSKEWGEFKNSYGTKAVRIGELQYTVHKLPLFNAYYAYAPKADLLNITNWDEIKASLIENNCFVLNLDVPNIISGTNEEKEALERVKKIEDMKRSGKNTFTKWNILLDISKSNEDILQNMHHKHRYNIGLAQKHGVTVRNVKSKEGFEVFYDLLEETGKRQKFLNHPKSYYEKIWYTFQPKNMAHILVAYYDTQPLSAWMLFTYENVLYYPYGGSHSRQKNLHANNLLAWEAIQLGKQKGCTLFDMWGSCQDLSNTNDPEWGFSNFKIKFGGTHVEYMDSYDLVTNSKYYNLFNYTYPKIMKILKALR